MNLTQVAADVGQALYDAFLAEQREMYGDIDEWAAAIYAEVGTKVALRVFAEHAGLADASADSNSDATGGTCI